MSQYFANLFWDLDVYLRAVQDFSHGLNSYRTDVDLLFIYHPYVLKGFVLVNELIDLKILLFGFYAVCTFLFLLICKKFLDPSALSDRMHSSAMLLGLSLASIAYGGAGLVALKTGNITTYLHLLLISTGYASVSANQKQWRYAFLCCVVIASVIKPYLLAYLLLSIQWKEPRQAWMFSVVAVMVFAWLWLSPLWFSPALYADFINALSFQTVGKGDLGYALFGMLRPIMGDTVAMLLHVLVMLGLLLSLAYLQWGVGKNAQLQRWLPLWLVLIIFLNPRMKEYDFCVAVFMAFVFAYRELPSRIGRVVAVAFSVSLIPAVLLAVQKYMGLNIHEALLARHPYQVFGVLLVCIYVVVLRQQVAKFSLRQ